MAGKRSHTTNSLAHLRSRLLVSGRFQRWALRTPLLRRVANRRARALFDLCAGFVYTQVLLACVRLRVLERLNEQPLALRPLAAQLALSPSAAERLLRAAISLRLVERGRSGLYRVGPLGAPLIANPALGRMIEHHELLYRDLRDPVALLREQSVETELSRYWTYSRAGGPHESDPEEAERYTDLMGATQRLVAQNVLDSYSVGRHARVLDIGGGNGTFLIEAAERCPELELLLFELPAVAEKARQNLHEFLKSGRARVFEGDFLKDPLPKGADLISLVRVIHDHDDESALALLQSVYGALAPGGRLLVAEPLAGTPGAEPVGDAYFGFYLLAMGQGRARTCSELKSLLRRARFRRVRRIRTRQPLITGLIVAHGQ